MIRAMISRLALSLNVLAMTLSAAASVTYELKGTGVDGKACEVILIKDGALIKDLKVKGAIKSFQFIADDGDPGDGSLRKVRPDAAKKAFGVIYGDPSYSKYAQRSENWLSDGEVYILTTDDMPIRGENYGASSFKLRIEFQYHEGRLIKAKASNSFRVLGIAPVDTASFFCE